MYSWAGSHLAISSAGTRELASLRTPQSAGYLLEVPGERDACTYDLAREWVGLSQPGNHFPLGPRKHLYGEAKALERAAAVRDPVDDPSGIVAEDDEQVGVARRRGPAGRERAEQYDGDDVGVPVAQRSGCGLEPPDRGRGVKERDGHRRR